MHGGSLVFFLATRDKRDDFKLSVEREKKKNVLQCLIANLP